MKEKPFKAKIKVGASVGIDHGFYIWQDADQEFECTYLGDGRFDARAPGYGGKPYGNGSVYLWSIDSLEMPIVQREALIAKIRAEKAQQIADAEASTSKLREELAAIV